MSFPLPNWLYLKLINERSQPRPDAGRLAREAHAALAEIDQAVADRARSTGSTCGRCRSPHCGLDYITGEYRAGNAAVWTRAARDAAEYKLDRVYQFGETPVEFSHHDGVILSVR